MRRCCQGKRIGDAEKYQALGDDRVNSALQRTHSRHLPVQRATSRQRHLFGRPLSDNLLPGVYPQLLMRPAKSVMLVLVVTSVLGHADPAHSEVTLSGLDDVQETNVRALLPLESVDCSAARWRVERLFRDADKDVNRALEALGYYETTIEKSLDWSESCWQATFDVQTGDPVRLQQIDIVIHGEARQDPAFVTRTELNRPASGDVLHHGRYENYKKSVINAAIARGYFEAAYSQSSITVDRESKTAAMRLALDSGPRYQVGQISFTEGILRDTLLAGYTDIESGDPYDADQISELYEVLTGSGYFSSVSINTEPLDAASNSVPLSVALTPGIRRSYSVGAGYATDTGPQARLGYANKRRNDKGHQYEIDMFWSDVDSKLTAAYRLPWSDPRHDWFSILAGIQHQDTETSENDTTKVGIARTHNVSRNWLQTQYIDLEFENFKVGDQDTSSRLLILGLNWEHAIGRELSRVQNGHRWNLDIRGASDVLVSDTTFLQFRAKTKFIHSFSDRTRLLARANLGITAKDSLTDLPASVRFFAGGDRSVRGYAYASLGPVDQNGLVIGGSNLLDGSLELDYSLFTRWSLAAFVDTGSAFEGTDMEFSTGVGMGVRWYSPIGPIRLDFAHPLDDPDQNLRVHIGLGPDL